jgi:hypothetical protein
MGSFILFFKLFEDVKMDDSSVQDSASSAQDSASSDQDSKQELDQLVETLFSDWKEHLRPETLKFLASILTIVPSSFIIDTFGFSWMMRLTPDYLLKLMYRSIAIFLAVRSMLESKNQLFFILLQAHDEYNMCSGTPAEKLAILETWRERFSLAFRPSGPLESHYNAWSKCMGDIYDIMFEPIPLRPFELDDPENVFWLINVMIFLTSNGHDLLKIVEMTSEKDVRKQIKAIVRAERAEHLSEFFQTFARLLDKYGPEFCYSSDIDAFSSEEEAASAPASDDDASS